MRRNTNGRGASGTGGELQDHLIDIRDVAALIGGSVSTARRLVRAGRIPPPLDLGLAGFQRWSDRSVRRALGLLDDREVRS